MIRKNLQTILTLVIITVMLSLTACNPSAKLEKQEKEDIQAFLGSTDSIFVKQQSGLYYNEIVPGTGVSPKIADSAYVKYTGKFLDESIFDSNVTTGKLYGFIIGQNIAGFDELP
jgi:FKBP-type peptidyl-prolyl cis-trans isomerase